MTKPDQPTRTPPPRTTSIPAPGKRTPPHEQRDDLGEGLFNVAWALPRTCQIPTLTRRAAALLIDLAIGSPMVLLAFALTEVSTGFALRKYDLMMRSLVLAVTLYAAYFALWESSSTRATPGKILTDLRVSTATEKPLTFASAMLRFWLSLVTALTLNAGLWLAWRDPRGRALHDRWSASTVVAHHLTPGQLRSASRGPRRIDLAALVLASVLGYGIVVDMAPTFVRQLRTADRLDAALAEVLPVLAVQGANPDDESWPPALRRASEATAELGVTLEIDRSGATLRARLEEDPSGPGSHPVSLRLERSDDGTSGTEWSCRARGLAMYALPTHCRELLLSPANIVPVPDRNDLP
ncbi:MAG TPA: RDD family protein [Casimicrobiaceae bacterium]|nr:RDD family protein [Casimicrobiaceae bacterium]